MANVKRIYLGTELLETVCKRCGTEFYQKLNGRTREYCCDNCRDYTKFLNALARTVDKIEFQDYSYVKSIKSDLFSFVNHLPKKI